MQPQIFGACEVMRIRAGPASDIQDAADGEDVVVAEHGSELLLSKRSLPESVRRHALHDAGDKRQSRHSTRNRPSSLEEGYAALNAPTTSGAIGPENSGPRLMTTVRIAACWRNSGIGSPSVGKTLLKSSIARVGFLSPDRK